VSLSSADGTLLGLPRRYHRPVRLAALALATTIPFAAACGGSDSPPTTSGAASTTTSATVTTSTSTTTSTAAGATKITVDETEFKITLSQSTFTPGSYEFAVKDAGKFPHNLVISGPGVDNQKIPTGSPLGAGQSATATVALQAGSYELYCGVPGHKEKGMDMTIQVA
jgi:uncharacterized cupredoxin-like copper-binding protein